MSCCLIYKVHTALSGGLSSYHSSFPLSSTFFKFFQTFSHSHSRVLCRVKRRPHGQPNYVTTLVFLCQVLFSGFFKSFSYFSGETGVVSPPSRTAYQGYHFRNHLSSTFFKFSKLIFKRRTLPIPLWISSNASLPGLFGAPHRKRSLIIAKSQPLVNTFFQVF